MGEQGMTRELLEIRDSLFAFILSLVRDFDMAEDVFQEVSVRILEHKETYTPGTNFGAWAREFARRVAFEEQRRRNRLLLSDKAITAVSDCFQVVEETETERRMALRTCMQRLSRQMRDVVRLRYEEGLSLSTIGINTRKTSGAVQVALHRTREWLGRCIRKQMTQGGAA
jgi:RNA polymerase sigma-70 factor, ECF subfamily